MNWFLMVDIVGVLTATALIITPIAATVGAYWARGSKGHAAKTNDAVNNVHPGNPTIYDLALENRVMHMERKASEKERNTSDTSAHLGIIAKLNKLEQQVQSHVDWEEKQKYNEFLAEIIELKKDK